MLKILVTYAVQGEFVEIKWPDVEPYYIRTGIGKVKSAFHLAEAIRQVQPDLVLISEVPGLSIIRLGIFLSAGSL
jgi:adenosylhomocysteine nucleosidase